MKPDDLAQLRQGVEDACLRLGQREFCRRAGVDRETLRDFLQQKRQTSERTLEKFRAFFRAADVARRQEQERQREAREAWEAQERPHTARGRYVYESYRQTHEALHHEGQPQKWRRTEPFRFDCTACVSPSQPAAPIWGRLETLEIRPAQTAVTATPSLEPVEEPSAPPGQPGAATQATEAEPAPVNPAVLEALDGPAAEAEWSQRACELASELASAHAREWLGEVWGKQFCDWLWSVLREGGTIPYQKGGLSFAYAPAWKRIRQEDERQWGGAVRRLLDLVGRGMGLGA